MERAGTQENVIVVVALKLIRSSSNCFVPLFFSHTDALFCAFEALFRFNCSHRIGMLTPSTCVLCYRNQNALFLNIKYVAARCDLFQTYCAHISARSQVFPPYGLFTTSFFSSRMLLPQEAALGGQTNRPTLSSSPCLRRRYLSSDLCALNRQK